MQRFIRIPFVLALVLVLALVFGSRIDVPRIYDKPSEFDPPLSLDPRLFNYEEARAALASAVASGIHPAYVTATSDTATVTVMLGMEQSARRSYRSPPSTSVGTGGATTSGTTTPDPAAHPSPLELHGHDPALDYRGYLWTSTSEPAPDDASIVAHDGCATAVTGSGHLAIEVRAAVRRACDKRAAVSAGDVIRSIAGQGGTVAAVGAGRISDGLDLTFFPLRNFDSFVSGPMTTYCNRFLCRFDTRRRDLSVSLTIVRPRFTSEQFDPSILRRDGGRFWAATVGSLDHAWNITQRR